MPATLRMPLRTSPDAPCFCGDANGLSHYLEEVQGLCQSRQQAADPDLINYVTYYTDEASWSTFAAIRDTLDNPKDWSKFKEAIHDLYLIHKVAHTPAALPTSLPLSSVPSAPLLGPLLSAAAVLLASDALQALLASHPRPVLPAGTVELQSPASSVLASQPLPMLPAIPVVLPLPSPSVCAPVPPVPPPASDALLLPALLVLPATSVPAILPPLPMPMPVTNGTDSYIMHT